MVGVVKYSFTATPEIRLHDYNTESSLSTAIRNIQYFAGGTNTDEALKYIYFNSFKAQEGGRDTAPDFLIVITDGMSHNVDATIMEARRLHSAHITVYAIGIGSYINTTELLQIATNRNHMFVVPDFHALHLLQTELHPIACTGTAGRY